ncbi:MAG: HisA/HisF-related TIM barrel protein [bacterium]
MLRLSNEAELDFLVASGALAFDGRGWPWEWPYRWLGKLDPSEFSIVVKTLTLKPRKGNLRLFKPWGCVRLIPNGVVNAVGLTNPGIEWWVRTCYPRMAKLGYRTIVSVWPESAEEAQTMAEMLKPLNIVAVELNASCPNTGHEIEDVESVVKISEALRGSGHPLIVKLSYNQPYVAIAKALEGCAEAVHAINSVPWSTVFPDKQSPLAKLGGGGVSGKLIRPFVRDAVKNLVDQTSLPVIAGGGIFNLEDVTQLSQLGASAFSLGSLFLKEPSRPNQLVREWQQSQKEKQFPTKR